MQLERPGDRVLAPGAARGGRLEPASSHLWPCIVDPRGQHLW